MKLTDIEKEKLKQVAKDPVLWAKVFVRTSDPSTKKVGPWTARWYQEEMLRDNSLRKVYRCGRRTGKTDTMIVEALYKTFTKRNYRVLFITPYENQIRLIFLRLKEILNDSPLLANEVTNVTMNPYMLRWKNGSAIMGFTTGASSGSSAASIRGQRADWIFVDECDYLGSGDFETVVMIAGERPDIGLTISSTPTGKRGIFYEACTNPKLGYSQHYHPSTHNPNWSEAMEAEFREQLTEEMYLREVLAEFGTEQEGVFPKSKIDFARSFDNYAYGELSYTQKLKVEETGVMPRMLIYESKAPPNPFRTIGVDWDKYGASSSLIILDYDHHMQKFRVLLRVEVPRSEYSYDNAIKTIVELNDKYNPSWIYCDRGAGEYQIERLHIIGDQRPSTGLKHKVKGFHFNNSLEIIDPITKQKVKEPLKPFMINQLTISFEREKIILSPYDDVLYNELIDFRVERISQNGVPIYRDENDHFISALALAHLAFVLEFPNITQTIKKPDIASRIETAQSVINKMGFKALESIKDPWSKAAKLEFDPTERRGDRPSWVKLPLGYKKSSGISSRTSGLKGGFSRTMW